ncbi:MAG TPA: methylated-DNA--[protein]-cysteine S-methyltransferase [Candidatus Hydrogenedentes bacterium]|nr:methylated-DNA--[protein]-cysteine S-methyltransferase [Candidatus Hydrogenedentota bacterium]
MLTAANFKFSVPDGAVYGYFSSAGLRTLELRDRDAAPPLLLHSAPNRAWGHALHGLLEHYFAGASVSFGDISLDLASGTPFQQIVWREAAKIPYGASATYGELARRIGNPRAARAVGAALGKNPVCIVVPCHRVLAVNGRIGGFSAGLHWKRRLLSLERIPCIE